MSRRHQLRVLLTLCVALVYGLGTHANAARLSKNVYFDENKWDLVPADNQPVAALSDLKDAVYSIQLSGERAGCGSTLGTGA